MDSAINWHDQNTFTKDRIIYIQEQHHIPGVHALARHTMKDSVPSLIWHYHENSFEFIISTRGSVSFCTLTSTYTFSGGDVFITFPNEIHGTNNAPISLGEIYWFQLDISNPANFLFMNEDAARDMISRLKSIPHHVVQVSFLISFFVSLYPYFLLTAMVPIKKSCFLRTFTSYLPYLFTPAAIE